MVNCSNTYLNSAVTIIFHVLVMINYDEMNSGFKKWKFNIKGLEIIKFRVG